MGIEEEKTVVIKKKVNDNDVQDSEKKEVKFVFDVNALKDAKRKLNKQQIKDEKERKEERRAKIENSDGVQGTIFSAISKLRRFHTDTDDEEESDSFYGSQD